MFSNFCSEIYARSQVIQFWAKNMGEQQVWYVRDLIKSVVGCSSSTILRFLLQSVVSFLLSTLIPLTLVEGLKVDPSKAVLISYSVVFLINFSLFRHFVFRATGNAISGQLIGFAFSSFLFRTGEYLLFLLLHKYAGVQYVLALFLVLGTSFVLKFMFYSRRVFAPNLE